MQKPTFSLKGSLFAGIMIGLGCIVNLSCDNRYVGAFLFSMALFFILIMKGQLYTGLCSNPKVNNFLFRCICMNLLGVACVAVPFGFAKPPIAASALAVTDGILAQPILSNLFFSFLCGVLMCLATTGWWANIDQNPLFSFLSVLYAIPCFVLSGFVHSIAVWGYGCLSLGTATSLADIGGILLSMVVSVCIFGIGNMIGSILIRLVLERKDQQSNSK